MQNLGLALISMTTGIIVDHYGFLYLEIFFIIWLISEWKWRGGKERKVETNLIVLFISVSLIATLVILTYDYNEKGILNMTPSERNNHPNNM